MLPVLQKKKKWRKRNHNWKNEKSNDNMIEALDSDTFSESKWSALQFILEYVSQNQKHNAMKEVKEEGYHNCSKWKRRGYEE